MQVRLHPAARAELHEAADWYALEAGNATASRFITDFEQARARILDTPSMGIAVCAKARKIPFRHFPYSLIYRLGKTTFFSSPSPITAAALDIGPGGGRWKRIKG